MTRAEARIKSAERRAKEAEAKLIKAYAAHRAAEDAFRRKHDPMVRAAQANARLAISALTTVKLAALGIEPMKTIVLWHPKYTGVTAMDRYAVRVTREGWTMLAPVGKSGRVMMNRNGKDGPYDLSKLIVTKDEVRE